MSEPIRVEVPMWLFTVWCLLLFIALLAAKPGQRLACMLATSGAFLHAPFVVCLGFVIALAAHRNIDDGNGEGGGHERHA